MRLTFVGFAMPKFTAPTSWWPDILGLFCVEPVGHKLRGELQEPTLRLFLAFVQNVLRVRHRVNASLSTMEM